MSDNVNHLELVKQAQLGCQESMSRLTQVAEGSLCAYIYRLTLNYDLTEELLQDTLLEMVKSLKKLKFERTNQFWAWLYRTALGKVQLHFRYQQNKRTIQMSMLDKEYLSSFASPDYNDGLNNMIRKELSDATFKAMAKLKLRHRNILALRCFEQKSYSEIAAIMDCSEIAAQVLFFRAKHSLKRQLSKHGFGKRLLLIALGLFAHMTTPAKAASAVSVTTASTKTGLAAAFIGTVITKLGITVITVLTATVVSLGVVTSLSNSNTSTGHHPVTGSGKVLFQYPYQVIGAYDSDGDGWKGAQSPMPVPIPITLEKRLLGVPQPKRFAVILPVVHWIEVKFKGRIVDGPGYDIILTEIDANGEQAGVFITDGNGNECPLGIALAGTSGQPSRTEIGFDIADINLPFIPCAVRIIGIKQGGATQGFDLASVRARIKIDQEQ